MITINASARLKQTAIKAATADDAGKIVLWVQKALPQAKAKKHGKAGKAEGMDFKFGKGDNAITISVLLDHAHEPPRILLEGSGGGDEWSAEESTGRRTIQAFKEQLKDTRATLGDDPDHAELSANLLKLIRAKSKVE
jgi:hypothetical protein